MNREQALASAIRAAHRAGDIIRIGLDRTLAIEDKGASNNLVTEIDRGAEQTIVSCLAADWPDSDFLGEEGQYPDRHKRWLWVIDPLDGTTNFIRGIRWFSVSIALWDRDLACPVVGVVYQPTSGELFRASVGGGAWLEEADGTSRRLQVSRAQEWPECLFSTGFYYDRGEAMRRTLAQAEAFMRHGVMDIRRLGSAALDLCQVAAGRLDGYWEHKLNPWDFMAGIVLVREAGGEVTTELGSPVGLTACGLVAANPDLRNKMQGLLLAIK